VRRATLSERALVLAPRGRDAALAVAMMTEAGFGAQACGSIPALINDLDAGAGFVIVTEEALATADLAPLDAWLRDQEEWSERVLGQHRYEAADAAVTSEAGEEGEADVHHALGLRDHDRAPSKARQPVPLPGVVPLDPVGLVLARVALPYRQHIIDSVVIRAVEARPPALQPFDQALAGRLVTTAAFPVHQLA
jgi:hypothetical protein